MLSALAFETNEDKRSR